MLVRRLELNDSLVLPDLFKKVVKDMTWYQPKTIQEIQNEHTQTLFEKLVLNQKAISLVAIENEKLVGFCYGGSTGGVFWISWIGVDKDFRKKKAGSKLLQKLEKEAKNNGLHKLSCCVLIDNKPSQKLFLSQEYSRYATVKKHWFGLDYYLYQKSL